MRRWKEVVIDTKLLCNGNHTEQWRVDFMAASATGAHKCVGSKNLTVDELNSGEVKSFKAGSHTVNVTRFELKPVVNFLEYIFGGCSLCLSVAIDFTGSNGQPS